MEMLYGVAILGSLAGLGWPVIAGWRQRPVIESLRANLRNLAAAQESHFYDFRGYAGDVEALRRTGFVPAGSVAVVIHEATRAGWSAAASHPGSPVRCFLFVREAAAVGSARTAGAVQCD